eukprot:CAMPEP_0179073464 /NCGR_PEP_ID=MMETSP0796-20121207/32582_1 /TAXON_ID=73915 /ORGANISM="Pyrodinium bahamense, Strain pbaha01" /LENGTH=439 /DNA_ID=CAMNT_0020770653 /DNA_START=1 /DNA_END=1320 /DNA_ORIENTATION=+
MRQFGFGAQGRQQSDQCSMPLCTICRAEIRVSYFVIGMFGYQLLQVVRAGGSRFMPLWWEILQQCGYFFVLYLTVLCHEFGHGNMARYLGGEIDHILLWVFGGICFSTRAATHDNRKLLRDDLLVVAAGPGTHFVQAPLWGLVLCLVFLICPQVEGWQLYKHPGEAFLAALNPMGNALSDVWVRLLLHKAVISALLWSLVGTAIQLNVALLLFNVFFPMYPADGSKLLVSTLMFCCGVPARKAAMVLLCFSVPCGMAFIGYSVMTFIAGVSAGQGGAAMLNSVMGFMGVMSLVEAYKIWELRKIQRLHTHPLFQTARSWNRVERDAFGNVHRINTSDFDDETPLTDGGACREACIGLCGICRPPARRASCLGCLCPCLFLSEGSDSEAAVSPPALSPQSEEVRAQRARGLLSQIEHQAAERQRDVRDLIENRQAQQPMG